MNATHIYLSIMQSTQIEAQLSRQVAIQPEDLLLGTLAAGGTATKIAASHGISLASLRQMRQKIIQNALSESGLDWEPLPTKERDQFYTPNAAHLEFSSETNTALKKFKSTSSMDCSLLAHLLSTNHNCQELLAATGANITNMIAALQAPPPISRTFSVKNGLHTHLFLPTSPQGVGKAINTARFLRHLTQTTPTGGGNDTQKETHKDKDLSWHLIQYNNADLPTWTWEATLTAKNGTKRGMQLKIETLEVSNPADSSCLPVTEILLSQRVINQRLCWRLLAKIMPFKNISLLPIRWLLADLIAKEGGEAN